MSRCPHGFLAGMCAVPSCAAWDGAVGYRAERRTRKARDTIVCSRCKRRVLRARIDPETGRCRGGCREVKSDWSGLKL